MGGDFMPCFHPVVYSWNGDRFPDSGKPKWKPEGPLGKGNYPLIASDPFKRLMPCKTCIGCRMEYSRQWANRMLMELDHWSGNGIFVTLTYRDADLPMSEQGHGTLLKSDMQKFYKRLRRRLETRFSSDKKFRYYYCGEYGKKTSRPHYHAILFGLSLSDFDDIQFLKENEIGQPLFTSQWLEDIWSHGIISLSACSYKTFGYVSRYVTKKVYRSEDREYWYDLFGVLPEYTNMSNRPGIGMFYFTDHPELDRDLTRLSIFDNNDVYDFPIPGKVLEKLISDHPEAVEQLKAVRKELAMSRVETILAQTNLDYTEYLANLEQDLIKCTSTLVRNFEEEL